MGSFCSKLTGTTDPEPDPGLDPGPDPAIVAVMSADAIVAQPVN